MSEVYWLGGAPLQDWEEHASRLGMRPAWIDEAHWFGLSPRPDWIASPPSFDWPATPAWLQMRLLQDVARLLLSGARSLVLLAAPEGACLLASPRAVGRLNLIPAARLLAWGTLPAASPPQAAIQAAGLALPEGLDFSSAAWQALYPPAPPPVEELALGPSRALELPATLLERCAALRAEINDPEELLWQLLEDRQLNQLEFARRQELDGQVIDFFCPQAGLVVLVDHRADLQDAYRMHVFAQHGLRVLRFWNSQVIEDTPEVLQAIWQAASGPPPAEEVEPPGVLPAAQPQIQALPGAAGIGSLNALCGTLQPGWRGLLVHNAPAEPLLYLAVEGV